MGEGAQVVWAIAAKDLAIEWRTKTAFVSALAFAVLVLAVLYFARDPTAVASLDVAPGALWVTFSFAAMLGLNRAFLLEQENRALDGVLLSGVPRPAIFLGKMLANLVFVGAVELVSVPLFILFYDVPLWHRVPELLGVTAMATLSFVAVGTLLSAMAVRTRFAELMLPLLLLPFLVPPVVGAVQVTARILAQRPLSEVAGWLKLLAAFDIVFLLLAVFLFEATLEE
ncbi:MAG: heme ABC transporter permease [Gemmatimonadales bacterium]|nr:MAG: heme ABC transporter permease [Gemmatimonadales bacterium]